MLGSGRGERLLVAITALEWALATMLFILPTYYLVETMGVTSRLIILATNEFIEGGQPTFEGSNDQYKAVGRV